MSEPIDPVLTDQVPKRNPMSNVQTDKILPDMFIAMCPGPGTVSST